MIVGAALSKIQAFTFCPRFVSLSFLGKFIVFPLVTFLFVWVDQTYVHFYARDIHHLLMILAIVPPAANIAAFAAQLNLQPERAATTILLGTLFALVYIPAVIWLLGIGG